MFTKNEIYFLSNICVKELSFLWKIDEFLDPIVLLCYLERCRHLMRLSQMLLAPTVS